MTETFSHIGVLGAGSWGTALANVIATNGAHVTLWSYRTDQAEAMAELRENEERLPGVALHERITPTAVDGDLAACDAVLSVVPVQSTRNVLTRMRDHIKQGAPVIACSKGLERETLKTMVSVITEAAPQARRAVLTGPSFAHEVAAGLPAAVTLAAETLELAGWLAEAISIPTFRVYLSDDIIGAEIGGAVKNVLAIACGILDGKGLGRSAHAGLITRGFAEMTRLGKALGARPETLQGLCGLGDLVLTCSSPQSRNMALGRALGGDRPVSDVLAGRSALTEGVASAPAVVELAKTVNVDVPICEAVKNVLTGSVTIDAAIEGLLSRPLKVEPV